MSWAVVGPLLEMSHPSGGMPWGASLSLLWGRQTTLLSLRPSQGGGATDSASSAPPVTPVREVELQAELKATRKAAAGACWLLPCM